MPNATLTGIKERPILFTGAMRQAILDGRKTQTRRLVKHPIPEGIKGLQTVGRSSLWQFHHNANNAPDGGLLEIVNIKCPYGKVGDRLYLSEPTQVLQVIEGKRALVKWLNDGDLACVDVTEQDVESLRNRKDWTAHCNARFMLKSFARTWLEVTGMRVERLQSISEEDAIAEGVYRIGKDFPEYKDSFNGPNRYTVACDGANLNAPTAKEAFAMLWDSINGKTCPWDSNPWAWVVSFKRVGGAA